MDSIGTASLVVGAYAGAKVKTDSPLLKNKKIVLKNETTISTSNSTTKVNPLENIKYTEKVLKQATQNDFHGFPECVDAYGEYGVITKITGGDGIIRTQVEIAGSYMGRDGVFQYIIEPDGVTCNHSLFVPN